jgi:hypothetical protein
MDLSPDDEEKLFSILSTQKEFFWDYVSCLQRVISYIFILRRSLWFMYNLYIQS